jgi:DNA-binding GntR family transcriptional regulator
MAADAIKNLAHKAAAMPRTVADHVADVLREAIAGGSLQAGTVLRQDELARQFQFSRMPVRDALRQLEAEGLVSIHPTRGAWLSLPWARRIWPRRDRRWTRSMASPMSPAGAC